MKDVCLAKPHARVCPFAAGAALDIVGRADTHVGALATWEVDVRLALFGDAVDLLGQTRIGVGVGDLRHRDRVRDRDRDLGHAPELYVAM